MAEALFSVLTDDIILNIFAKLDDDPRHWARVACVCTRFSSLVRHFCWKNKCCQALPSLVSDLLSSSSAGDWASLHKLAVCCPGLLHAGVLLDPSEFGLDRDLGPDHSYQPLRIHSHSPATASASGSESDCCWSLFDDLYHDTVHDPSEPRCVSDSEPQLVVDKGVFGRKRLKICRSWGWSHLASGTWNLSREQGSKLLARQFRDDCLYICDWPGCVHYEEKRKYRLFRGVFKNFKRTRVWRNVNDGNRRKIEMACAFCQCRETWDLHSAFCLRRGFGFGYHDDGEPVVRAYVCENGHVSGAWTDVPMYS